MGGPATLVQETTVGSPGRVAPSAVSSDSAAAGPRAFSDTPTLRCAEWGLEAFQVPSPRLPAELWVGKEGRAGSAAGPAHSSGWSRWEGYWKHLVPRGHTEGFVWYGESRKLPTLGKSPPSLRVGLVTTSSADGHTQAGLPQAAGGEGVVVTGRLAPLCLGFLL